MLEWSGSEIGGETRKEETWEELGEVEEREREKSWGSMWNLKVKLEG